MSKKIIPKWLRLQRKKHQVPIVPVVLSAQEHGIQRAQISRHAISVMKRLNEKGFRACLVGGGVRDLLLGIQPKDFDVATDALPHQICGVFRNSRVIGRRFRLVHVYFGREIIEIATFRSAADTSGWKKYNPFTKHHQEPVYGRIEDDVWRRDCSVNALYYDIKDHAIIDYVHGFRDLHNKTIRMIGVPQDRYQEDPVRMLRVVRFAAKLAFNIDAQTAEAINSVSGLISNVSSARLYIEVIKLFQTGCGVRAFELLRSYGLFQVLFHQVHAYLCNDYAKVHHALIIKSLEQTDERYAAQLPLSEAYVFVVFLWYPLQGNLKKYHKKAYEAQHIPVADMVSVMDALLAQQTRQTLITRRLAAMIRTIWLLQYRFAQCPEEDWGSFLQHTHFKAAYDFLLLRAAVDPALQDLAMRWQAYYASMEGKLLERKKPSAGRSARRRRRHTK